MVVCGPNPLLVTTARSRGHLPGALARAAGTSTVYIVVVSFVMRARQFWSKICARRAQANFRSIFFENPNLKPGSAGAQTTTQVVTRVCCPRTRSLLQRVLLEPRTRVRSGGRNTALCRKSLCEYGCHTRTAAILGGDTGEGRPKTKKISVL